MTATGVPRSKADQVADALREEIRKMQPGERLPTQRELVERFGFAGQTVQNGLAILRAEGAIVSAGNMGNFVSGEPQGDKGDELKEIRSQIQALTERVAALEARSEPGRT
ncbi:GntR family transcriptional regulator [Streptomyces sp. NPDC088752]|uniref:GntR family transcriptional regulator n=1 Tax=Streptomyces sp. NPDC088752 TaxID=3154963 RepID=UPI0034416150